MDATWTAESGYYYYETEQYRDQGGNTLSRRVQRIRWETSSGALKHFFDDALVPGTRGRSCVTDGAGDENGAQRETMSHAFPFSPTYRNRPSATSPSATSKARQAQRAAKYTLPPSLLTTPCHR